MGYFIHVDRSGQLEAGQVLTAEPVPPGKPLPDAAKLFGDAFVTHLQNLCSQGLSNHGISYLFRLPMQSESGLLVLEELQLEYVRWKYQIDAPSRYQALFAFGTLQDASRFYRTMDDAANRRIVEVEAFGDNKPLNMVLSRSVESAAVSYWNGEEYSRRYQPEWEYILPMPVKVVKIFGF